MKKYDVTIIGGGPAGTTAALYLNKQGFSVCIIEKKLFPRETLCGEFLSHEVTAILKDLNLFEDFLDLNPNPIKSFKLYGKDGSFIETALNFAAYGMKRGRFDCFLLDHARMHGVDVFQPCEVKELSKNGNDHCVLIDEGSSKFQIFSKRLIAAYGKQNILDKKLKRAFTGTATGFNGIKFHLPLSIFKKIETGAIHIIASKGLYCGMNVVERESVTVCFLENRESSKDNARRRLILLIQSNKAMTDLFGASFENAITEAQLYGTGNIFFGPKELVQDGVFMIGDSAAVIAPVAGDGIGMAMQSAKLISEVFDLQGRNGLSDDMTEKLYIKRWNKTFKPRLRTALFLQTNLLSTPMMSVGFRILKFFPHLVQGLVKATRA